MILKKIMKIVSWPVARLIPYARNARTIPQAAVDKVAASIKEFGWQQPIVVDSDGVVVAGHVRLLAAKQLGLEQVPVHIATELTPGQIKAFRLMDNRSHQESGWDVELLAPEMAELQGLNVDVALTGFDAEEIANFLGAETNGTPPDTFKEFDETIPTAHECPKCGYTWSGAAAPKAEATSEPEAPAADEKAA
jgi:ParB-like nuclease domain